MANPPDHDALRARIASVPDSTGFLVGLIEASPLAIQVYQASGESLLVNRAFEALFGCAPPPDYNVLADDLLARRGLLGSLRRAFAGETIELPPIWYDPRELEQVEVPAGRRVAISSIAFPLRDRDGRVEHVVLVFQDHTADVERRELLESIVEQSGQGIIVADADGVVRIFNPEATRQHGRGLEEVGAESWSAAYGLRKLDGTPLPLEETPLYQALRGSRVDEQPWVVERPDGSCRILVGTAAPLRRADGSSAGAVLMTRDDTERSELEAELRRTAAREQQARAEAEAAASARDDFLAMLGHELRNPLAPIVMALELLRDREPGVPSQELAILDRQVGHVVRLVDDLLDVAKVTRGKIHLDLERIDLARVVADAVEIAGPRLEDRGHHLELAVESGHIVDGDPGRLAQVVANLLTNAAAYTDPGGRVVVTVTGAGDEVVLRVADDGAGIPADVLPRIFDMFTQGPRSSDRPGGGLGLGLALVRGLVELHRGTVVARSEGPGRGSELEIRLPIAAGTAASDVRQRSVPWDAATTSRRHVLLVDDNVDAAMMTAEVLRSAGHEVDVAHDGGEALRLAAVRAPEVAVLDLGLPDMDGYELAARLIEQLGAQAVPRLVALTGYGHDRDRARTGAAGFVDHLVKPVKIRQLLAAILGERVP